MTQPCRIAPVARRNETSKQLEIICKPSKPQASLRLFFI
jgi:hypothetical protein